MNLNVFLNCPPSHIHQGILDVEISSNLQRLFYAIQVEIFGPEKMKMLYYLYFIWSPNLTDFDLKNKPPFNQLHSISMRMLSYVYICASIFSIPMIRNIRYRRDQRQLEEEEEIWFNEEDDFSDVVPTSKADIETYSMHSPAI